MTTRVSVSSVDPISSLSVTYGGALVLCRTLTRGTKQWFAPSVTIGLPLAYGFVKESAFPLAYERGSVFAGFRIDEGLVVDADLAFAAAALFRSR